MKRDPTGSFGPQLRTLREAAGYTQEELATIAGLSVHGVSALERGERRRPHVETVRALCAALDLTTAARDALVRSARAQPADTTFDDTAGNSLPIPLTGLLGRDGEMHTLREWLADPAIRLITLTGPGGAGKTRLALELAHARAAERSFRVAFVPLATSRTPAFVASAIAEVLGLSDATLSDLPKRARAACDARPTLLLLDNFEQVLDAAPLVADLLASAASLRVLATSRAALRIRGEREFVVGALAMGAEADASSPAVLARCPAVRLFVERVRDVQPEFRLTAANGPTVVAICRRLDALPLAIELAAPWMRVLSAEKLLGRLGVDLLLSPAAPRDLPERQQTMNATVAWSYQLLDPEEQRAFRRLGVLPGLFPIDAAAAVLAGRDGRANEGDALRAVVSLIDKSLLARAMPSAMGTCTLYQMLDTVRAYAALEIPAPEREDAMEGLVRYCASEAALAASGLVGPEQADWLDRVREDLESYRAVLAWLIDRGRPAEAAGIASPLMPYWVIRGHASEGLQWHEQILDLPSLPTRLEGRALAAAAMMYYSLGQIDRAHTALSRAKGLARDCDDVETLADAEHLLGHVEHGRGNVDTARDRFATGIELFRALAIPWGLGNSLNGMAKVALTKGDNAEAERLLDEAATVLRDSPWFLALVSYRRAILAVRRGNPDDAIALARESLTLFGRLQEKFAIIYVMVPLAAAAALKGDLLWAARVLGARDAVTERTGATIVDQWVLALGEQTEREVRASLGADRWGRAYAAGRMTSVDTLLKDIERVARKGRTPR